MEMFDEKWQKSLEREAMLLAINRTAYTAIQKNDGISSHLGIIFFFVCLFFSVFFVSVFVVKKSIKKNPRTIENKKSVEWLKQLKHKRIEVYWMEDEQYYAGIIDKIDTNKKKSVHVEYDDGEGKKKNTKRHNAKFRNLFLFLRFCVILFFFVWSLLFLSHT